MLYGQAAAIAVAVSGLAPDFPSDFCAAAS